MRMVYPVGPRPPMARLLLLVTVLAAATVVWLGPTYSPAHKVPSARKLEVGADSAAVSAKPSPVPRHDRKARVHATAVAPATAAKPIDQVAPGSLVELGAMDSQPSESFDGFLVRVAQVMDAFTSTTGHEVCGVLMAADAGDAWRARLTTNRSHIGCLMVSFDDPGFSRMGEDIHSHPRLVGGVAANAQDVQRRPDFQCGQNIVVFDETFSSLDLERGPGYLVSRNRLLYQHGADKPFRQLAVFPSLAQPVQLDTSRLASRVDQVSPQEAAAAAWAGAEMPGIPATHCQDGVDTSAPSPRAEP